MITDKISNFYKYSKLFPEAFKIIQENDLFKFQPGRHPVNENVFILVNEYETNLQPKTQYENHHEYVDIQLLLQGQEDIGYAEVSELKPVKSYDSEQDYELLEGEGNLLTLHYGSFIIFFPGEAHQPGIANCNTTSSNRKLIFKVKFQDYAG